MAKKHYWNKKLNQGLEEVETEYKYGFKNKSPYTFLDGQLNNLVKAPTNYQIKFIKSLIPEHIRCIKKESNWRDKNFNSRAKELYELSKEGINIEYLAQPIALEKAAFPFFKSEKLVSNWDLWHSAFETVKIDSIIKLGEHKKHFTVLNGEIDYNRLFELYKPE